MRDVYGKHQLTELPQGAALWGALGATRIGSPWYAFKTSAGSIHRRREDIGWDRLVHHSYDYSFSGEVKIIAAHFAPWPFPVAAGVLRIKLWVPAILPSKATGRSFSQILSLPLMPCVFLLPFHVRPWAASEVEVCGRPSRDRSTRELGAAMGEGLGVGWRSTRQSLPLQQQWRRA